MIQKKPKTRLIHSITSQSNSSRVDSYTTMWYVNNSKSSQYILEMKKYFSTIEKSKLRRMIEEAMSNNTSFHAYIKTLPSEALSINDIAEFEAKIKKNNILNRNKLGYLSKVNAETQNQLEIKTGFDFLQRKLQEYEYNNFRSQVKYLKQVLQRETDKLKYSGEQYQAATLVNKQRSNMNKILLGGENQVGFINAVKKTTRNKLSDLDELTRQFAMMI